MPHDHLCPQTKTWKPSCSAFLPRPFLASVQKQMLLPSFAVRTYESHLLAVSPEAVRAQGTDEPSSLRHHPGSIAIATLAANNAASKVFSTKLPLLAIRPRRRMACNPQRSLRGQNDPSLTRKPFLQVGSRAPSQSLVAVPLCVRQGGGGGKLQGTMLSPGQQIWPMNSPPSSYLSPMIP